MIHLGLDAVSRASAGFLRDSVRPKLLHGDKVVRTREIQEVEVESVAYIVCDTLGLDTSDYSFAYVAR